MEKKETVFETIKTRRSTRNYSDREVSKEDLDMVLEAGRFAPSGGNNQTTHLLVITSQEIKEKIAKLAEKLFSGMEVMPDTYKSMASAILSSKKGGYNFHRNAPVLILTANKKTYSNNIADCSCVLENMMIMANALDLGSCWVNQIKWLNEEPEMLELLYGIGLREDERVYGGLTLGYADTPDGLPSRNPLERKGNEVTFVI
ncbi:MAG: nitroreductase [Oscillospiraceae bacterium]|nr:nitroreductase [Oscillospiraceae bacterium]